MADTREALLLAAESLFAAKGIDGTSVREVNRLAGQKNTSAIRYHFDGMGGLVAALIERRMSELDAARADALAALDPQAAGPEAFVAVLVLPLAERVESDPAWASWVQVLAQLISLRGREHRAHWEGRYDRTTRRVFARLRKGVPAVPDRVWRQRVDDMMLLCIGSLCERVASDRSSSRSSRLGAAAYQRNLVSTATALLRAPV